jgi:hypothetical protein
VLVLAVPFLAGCNALGGVPADAIANARSATASCVRVTGLWGSGVVTTANTDKGVIVDGSVTVNPENCGMVIVNRPKPVAVESPRLASPPALPGPQ